MLVATKHPDLYQNLRASLIVFLPVLEQGKQQVWSIYLDVEAAGASELKRLMDSHTTKVIITVSCPMGVLSFQ